MGQAASSKAASSKAAPSKAAPSKAAPSKAAPAQGRVKKIKLLPHQVVLRPLVTEKGMHRATRNNQYAFEVNALAEKLDVREAVETLFNVKVLKVRTQNRKGKPRRYRFTYGRTKNWKKAIVTLDSEDRIDFF